jgi:hypothetical protein
MTKENTTELLSLIKLAYPRFYTNLTKQDALATIDLWTAMFKNCDYTLVKMATQTLINTLEFPPTIADIKNEMYKLVNHDEDTALDEWNLIKSAMQSPYDRMGEAFNRLPYCARKFVGNPRQLKDWATSTDFNDGVLRGQFLKQYDLLKDREKHNELMPNDVRDFISNLAEKKMIGGIS